MRTAFLMSKMVREGRVAAIAKCAGVVYKDFLRDLVPTTMMLEPIWGPPFGPAP